MEGRLGRRGEVFIDVLLAWRKPRRGVEMRSFLLFSNEKGFDSRKFLDNKVYYF